MLGEGMAPSEGDDRAAAGAATKRRERSDEASASPIDMRRIVTLTVASYYFVMTVFVVPLACVSTFLLLCFIRPFSMRLFLKLENGLCRFVNDHWVAASVYCGMQVEVYGDDLAPLTESRSLFLANHLALLDHFIIMNSLHDRGTVPGRWMWVIYNIWKYTPLGAMWTSHGNFFVNGGATKRERLLETFRKHLADYFWSWNYGWIVMYPEGSRLFMIKESSGRFAEKNGLAPLRHCVYPRTGAAHAVMQVTAPNPSDPSVARSGGGPPLEYLIDATLGYPRGDAPDLQAVLLGEWPHDTPRMAVHYKVYKVRPEWADEEKLQQFLYECYRKKDDLLDKYYKTGEFDGPSRTVQVNTWSIGASQVFWIVLYYIHYVAWLHPLCTSVLSSLLF